MTGLVLVGAGGLAREVLAMERDSDRFSSFAVVDDDPARWGTSLAGSVGGVGGVPVLGGLEEVAALPRHRVVVCLGRGEARRAVVERLGHLGIGPARYATLVRRRAVVPTGCSVGVGSIVLAGAVLTADVAVGRHVVLMPHVTLTHDDVVDDFATLCAGVSLGGGVRVGAAAYVGTHACVRESRTVGAGATLGMGSVLLHDLPDDQTWAGVPAAALQITELAGGRS